jgi:NAD(P)-dependent dehydrogenase (short-subunit alcohol dehydrogenase family)
LLLASKAASPLFPASGGAIVNISSVVSALTPATASIYASSKAAVVAITKSLAKELAPRNIRVNAINPGVRADGVPVGEPAMCVAEQAGRHEPPAFGLCCSTSRRGSGIGCWAAARSKRRLAHGGAPSDNAQTLAPCRPMLKFLRCLPGER